MDIRRTLSLCLLMSTGLIFGADNKLASLTTVLTNFKVLTKLSKTDSEQLPKQFLDQAKLRLNLDLLESYDTIGKTLDVVRIFCSQRITPQNDWMPLHNALKQLSPQQKLSILTFAHSLAASKKLLNILAHGLRQDFIENQALLIMLKERLAQCPFELTKRVWKKIGTYKGTKKPKSCTIFAKQNFLQIPLKQKLQLINITNGKKAGLSTINTVQEKSLPLSPWETKGLKKTFKNGSYSITYSPAGETLKGFHKKGYSPYKIEVKTEKNGLSLPISYRGNKQSQLGINNRFFAIIEQFNGKEDSADTMHAHLFNFEHNCDEQLPVFSKYDQEKLSNTYNYDHTKIRYTKDVVFAKGPHAVVGVDLNTRKQTKFESKYVIKDVYIQPNGQYIAICTETGKEKYSYDLFKLEPQKISLDSYIKNNISTICGNIKKEPVFKP